MARSYGSAAKLALKRGTAGQAWGTGTVPTLGAGHRFPFKSYSIDRVRETVQDDSITGTAERAQSSYGNKRLAGSIVTIMDPRQLPPYLSAMLLGAAGAPTALSGADTGAYTHSLLWSPQSSQEGLWQSAGIDAGADVFQHKYLKCTRRVISGRTGSYLEAAFEFLGRGEDRSVSSGSWSYTADPTGNGARLLLMRQAVLRINAQSGGALGSSDKVYPVSFELDVSRGQTQDYAQQGESEEPLPGDFAEIMLRLSFFQMDSTLTTLFRDAVDAGTKLKADLVVTGDDLIIGGGSQYFAWEAYLPNLHIVDDPFSVDGPGPVPFRVTLSGHQAASAPTGFPTGFNEALCEKWHNAISADLLA